MFRKRRRPTPHFKIPSPYNPIAGEQASLQQQGVSPFCAMMQVAAEDDYENHVICRGFDPRILKFIDYVEGDTNKPGISVAKPFGKRKTGLYKIGQVYPAFLPTQGNADFTDFRQVTHVPPSPSSVNWRVGQNPGVVSGGLDGGQPSDLGETIEILYDHNGKVINWLLADGPLGDAALVVFELTGDLDTGIGESAIATVVATSDASVVVVGENILVRNTGMAFGYSGARGIAIKTKFDWWVIEINQHALLFTAELTGATHGLSVGGTITPGSREDQVASISFNNVKLLTPYPFNDYEIQDIHNPFNFHGQDGDTILVAHVEDDYTYQFDEGDPVTSKNIIIAVFPAIAREFFVKMTSNVPTGTVTPVITSKGWGPYGNNSGQIPAFRTALDRYYLTHNGGINQTGIVAYDMLNDLYVVRAMEHDATRVRCSFAEDFCNAPESFLATIEYGYNGATPSGGTLTVQNRYGMEVGKEGNPLDVLWDQQAGEWYPERTIPPGAIIEYVIDLVNDAETTGPYTGLKIADVTIKGASCGMECLIGTTASVVDHSNCIFDIEDGELTMSGYTGWAYWSAYATKEEVTVVLTTTEETAIGSGVLTFESTTGVAPGMSVSGAGIPAGATVTGVTGTTVTISPVSAEGVSTGTPITFTGVPCDKLTPCHWSAFNRCCDPNTGSYAAPCPEPE